MFEPLNTLLKDIDLSPVPECPSEYLHRDGTIGIICDQEGFEYIMAMPFLAICNALYNLNVRTLSTGSNAKDEIGVSIDYDSLNDLNKKYADFYMLQTKQKLNEKSSNMPYRICRISVKVNMAKDTIASAKKKLHKAMVELGLEQQDVLYGRKPALVRANEICKNYFAGDLKTPMEKIMKIAAENKECFEHGEAWVSRELYEKHMQYLEYVKQEEKNKIKRKK